MRIEHITLWAEEIGILKICVSGFIRNGEGYIPRTDDNCRSAPESVRTSRLDSEHGPRL